MSKAYGIEKFALPDAQVADDADGDWDSYSDALATAKDTAEGWDRIVVTEITKEPVAIVRSRQKVTVEKVK